MLGASLRLLRTIRPLRAAQLVAQVTHRLPKRYPGPVEAAEPMPEIRWRPHDFPAPIGEAGDYEGEILAGRLSFVGRKEAMGFPPAWNRRDLPRLWLYNLHYHEFLWHLGYEDARTTVLDWISGHPPRAGQAGWDAYPISLRLVNWCTLFFGRYTAQTMGDVAFCQSLWTSIRGQALHLERNLEWHLMANHLLENAVALAVVGSCFRHRDADRWLDKGCGLLKRELPEQILADGGHYERSPMYQCRVLHDLRVLMATQEPSLTALAAPYVTAVTGALRAMTHPDGDIALLNDSALGVYPMPDPVAREPGPFALHETGYYGAQNDDGDYIICDAGPMGPDYQPGHGHADLFSFELSFGGSRVVVDSGVSTYEPGAMRDYCRSTRAHNTVEVGGADQAELWRGFRVGRRAVPTDVQWRGSPSRLTLSAEHGGYGHLPGSPRHRRSFAWHRLGVLAITDQVSATRPVNAVARLHLHPACQVEGLTDGRCTIRFPGGGADISWEGWQEAELTDSTYSPRFGVETSNRCLVLSSRIAMLEARIRLEKH